MVYHNFKLGLIQQENWENLDYNNYESKIKKINQLVDLTTEKIIETFNKKEKKVEKPGMFDDIITKIIDNIVITIKYYTVNYRNVHLRVEQSNILPYLSIGISMEEFSLFSINDMGVRVFVDRSKTKNLGTNRIINILNFGVYFNPNETEISINSKIPEFSGNNKYQFIIMPCNL